ncbi:cytochrome P450 [Gigaspora rosea]|uniref:Cytochrome P450 n=1 Tax=Gigaspora rosea TaxID=44941 RepID=A0A397TUU7_9GLOM|nr:cytochrome P450 [Gigaspora rosea]
MQNFARNGDSENLFIGYVFEALRRSPAVPGLLRIAKNDTNIGNTRIKKDDLIFANLEQTHMDPNQFKDPENINPARYNDDKDKYKLFGGRMHGFFGEYIISVALPTILKVIISRPKIKRVEGTAGKLNYVTDKGKRKFYINSEVPFVLILLI